MYDVWLQQLSGLPVSNCTFEHGVVERSLASMVRSHVTFVRGLRRLVVAGFAHVRVVRVREEPSEPEGEPQEVGASGGARRVGP
jgi:hypothetical protein